MRLSAGQLIGVVTTLLGLILSGIGAWYDLKTRVEVTRTTVELSTAALSQRIDRLEHRR